MFSPAHCKQEAWELLIGVGNHLVTPKESSLRLKQHWKEVLERNWEFCDVIETRGQTLSNAWHTSGFQFPTWLSFSVGLRLSLSHVFCYLNWRIPKRYNYYMPSTANNKGKSESIMSRDLHVSDRNIKATNCRVVSFRINGKRWVHLARRTH